MIELLNANGYQKQASCGWPLLATVACTQKNPQGDKTSTSQIAPKIQLALSIFIAEQTRTVKGFSNFRLKKCFYLYSNILRVFWVLYVAYIIDWKENT